MRNITEHLTFAALLIPTLILLSAAVVSLAPLDTSVAVPTQVSLLAAPEEEVY
ncbi:MAG TPA: hypothetical protein VFK84_09140 [Burkholderiales bacterium]|nr:hypothetical protein [Burkholderiales bacterium]